MVHAARLNTFLIFAVAAAARVATVLRSLAGGKPRLAGANPQSHCGPRAKEDDQSHAFPAAEATQLEFNCVCGCAGALPERARPRRRRRRPRRADRAARRVGGSAAVAGRPLSPGRLAVPGRRACPADADLLLVPPQPDRAYLHWTIAAWDPPRRRRPAGRGPCAPPQARRAAARAAGPAGPAAKRLAYSRRLTLEPPPDLPGARDAHVRDGPRAHAKRHAPALAASGAPPRPSLVSRHAVRRAGSRLAEGRVPLHPPLRGGLDVEHRQRLLRRPADGRPFQSRYASDFVGRWGTADNWPAWAQLEAAARAHDSGRGFTPWPNTARFCGLLS